MTLEIKQKKRNLPFARLKSIEINIGMSITNAYEKDQSDHFGIPQELNGAEDLSGFKDFWHLSFFQAASGGPLTSITFQEFPPSNIVTDQYAYLGIEFIDGNDKIISGPIFEMDGVVVRGG